MEIVVTGFLPRIVNPKAPPLKSQGIKTKLVPFIAESIAWQGTGRWVEPFVGSGAVVLNIAPKHALLADSNEHIIRLYKDIQSGEISAARVKEHLTIEGEKLSKEGEDHYYSVRTRFNAASDPLDLIFLNRSCFNGVMRFNKKGQFNVPFCRKPNRFRQALISKITNQVSWAARVMAGKDWRFECQPWRTTLAAVNPEDFVYLDPPYVGRHTDYYNQWSDIEADNLASAVKALTCGFAYSMWKANKYRENSHLTEHFEGYPLETYSHFYHVGPSEDLRNEMEEALVLKHGHLAQTLEYSGLNPSGAWLSSS